MSGIKEITRNFGKKALFGIYRGFDVSLVRSSQLGGGDGFRFALKGAGDQEFQPTNLIYSFEDKFSLTGLFQRLDNFLAKGLDEGMETYRDNARRETAELDTVKAALGKEFPQQNELALVRENHGGIIRELQRMQDDSGYVSEWKPKTALVAEAAPIPASEAREPERDNVPEACQATAYKLKFGDGDGRTEYSISNQHIGHTQDGHVLHRTYYSKQVGSLGQSLYDDGHWHTTAAVPRGVRLQYFGTPEAAMEVARNNPAQRGLEGEEAQPVKMVDVEAPTVRPAYHSRLADAGFYLTSTDFYGKDEYKLTLNANDGGTFDVRVFQADKEKVGLHVQYEKGRILDGRWTVHTQFDTLDEVMVCVRGYLKLSECHNSTEMPIVAPVRGEVEQESSRMRMR